jgi:AcrR family transcriptional regulator
MASDPIEQIDLTKKELILHAATKLFFERDFLAVSTKEIAVAAGVAKGTIFHHFAKKELLALAVMDHFMSDMIEEIKQMKASVAPDVLLREIVKQNMELAASAPGLIRLLLQVLTDEKRLETDPTNSVEQQIKTEMDHIVKLMFSFIDEFAEIFQELGAKDPHIQSRLFIGILDAIALQMVLEPEPDEKLISRLTDGILALFIKKEGK